MIPRNKLAFAVCSTLLVAVVACGGAPAHASDFDQVTEPGGFGEGESGGGGPVGGSSGGSGAHGALAACATQSATAEARPVYLVFIFDNSNSMNDDGKWEASKAATRAFFESPQSKGISASLAFFPGDRQNLCDGRTYKTPSVAMSALPNATFGRVLDARGRNRDTPTRPALEGAIGYAQTVADGEGKDGKVAVVLVTDGIPQGCQNESIENVTDVAASVAATFPTYVIGVGRELESLNAIAAGGGTTSAHFVNVGEPAQTQAEFSQAIETIRSSALTCDYKIPAPPTGESFDRSKVNVQHFTSGAAETLSYDQTCASGSGWKYDNPQQPARILLCDGTCAGVKRSSGKVDIVFGCGTQAAPLK